MMPSTAAAAIILGRVAKRAASYETELLVPHREPITMAIRRKLGKHFPAGRICRRSTFMQQDLILAGGVIGGR